MVVIAHNRQASSGLACAPGAGTNGTGGATGVSMVRLSVAVHATSARTAQDLLDALRFIALSTQLEPGCLGCSAWSTPDAVRYVEEWLTEADMRRRVRSNGFTPLLAITEAAAQHEVQFDFVTRTRGLDYVAEMRADVPGSYTVTPED